MSRFPFWKKKTAHTEAPPSNDAEAWGTPKGPLGLSVVWPEEFSSYTQDVDIVLVHGLNGGSRGSWTSGSVFWPRDLLPDIVGNVRIMCFGYNTNLYFNSAEGSISTFAENLLAALIVKRTGLENRPLIFIGHSLGGLVIKRALTITLTRSSFPAIRQATTSIVFLGTPHRGTDLASYGHFVVYMFAVLRGARVTASTQELQKFSNSIANINSDFKDLASSLAIVSFNEQLTMPPFGLIVEPGSARMDHPSERYCVALSANHAELCKFNGPGDNNFVVVSEQLNLLVNEARASSRKPSIVTLSSMTLEDERRGSNAFSSFQSPVTMSSGRRRSEAPSQDIKISTIDDAFHNLPSFARSAFFGREPLVQAIGKILSSEANGTPNVFGLYGIGGVGKTQIALKYAYASLEEYRFIFFMHADTEATLMKDVDDVTRSMLSLGDIKSAVKGRDDFKAWLSENSKWLLIFDNADNLEVLKPYLPTCRHGSILITSRDPDIVNSRFGSQGLEVEPFALEDGAKFLLEQLRDGAESLDVAKKASRVFGGLPLALCQLIGYIDSNQSSLQDFLELPQIKALSFKLLDKYEDDVIKFNYALSFATAFDQQLIKLKEHSEARELLEMLALLDPDCVAEALLMQGASKMPASALPCLQDVGKYNEAIGILRKRSLLKKDRHTRQLSIHRMVRWAIFRKWTKEDSQMAFDRVIKLLGAVFPRQVKGQTLTVGADLERCRAAAAHVYALEVQYRELKSNVHVSIDFAELLANYGFYLIERGQPKTALGILYSAREICEAEVGDTPNLITALVLNNIAVVHSGLNQIPQALELNLRVITFRETLLGGNNQELANSFINLATNYYDLDQLKKAETYYLRALEIFEREPEVTPQMLAVLLSNAGRNYVRLERYTEAEDMLSRALALQRTHNGNLHYFTTATIYRLCNLRLRQNRLDAADDLITECLALRRRLLGDEDYRAGVAMHKMAAIRFRQGRIDEGMELLSSAIKAFERNEGACEGGLIIRSVLLKAIMLKRQGMALGNDSQVKEAENMRRRGDDLNMVLENSLPNRALDDEDELDKLVQPDFR